MLVLKNTAKKVREISQIQLPRIQKELLDQKKRQDVTKDVNELQDFKQKITNRLNETANIMVKNSAELIEVQEL